jgi:hypothetical protein
MMNSVEGYPGKLMNPLARLAFIIYHKKRREGPWTAMTRMRAGAP